MYAIMGATGNIGKLIAIKLLEQGKQVRTMARERGRLQTLLDRGAEAAVGTAHDAEFLERTFEGATAVFTMIPPNLKAENLDAHQDAVGEAVFSALKRSGVRQVVNLSSAGADLPSGTGPIAGLHRQEQRLNQIEDIHLVHLRPVFFMENFLSNIPMIRHMGISGSSMKGDLRNPMICTYDIAEYAVKRLLLLDFYGKTVVELLGQRDLTMAEATSILGKAIGKPDLQYVQFSYEDAENGMIQAGIAPDTARSFNEMADAFNNGLIRTSPRTSENTTPTSIEEFAEKVFAPAYQSAN